ncbi:MAG: DUF2851 family protein [Parachlamydiaceae bacterium]
MASSCYSRIVRSLHSTQTTSQAEESKTVYHVLTERHLQAMWLEQKYFKPLFSTNNDPIEVLSPGIWNSEAGPDFLKAHIKIGNLDLRGDIELHLSQEGWYHHHHHEDPRYDGVILHVCYWDPVKERPIVTSKEKRIPSTFINSRLTIPESRLLKLIDLDLYPYKIFTGSGRCARLFFNKTSQNDTLNLLRSAALWRLEEKWHRLQTQVDAVEDCLLGGICVALGYKNNAEAFLTLFRAVSDAEVIPLPALRARKEITSESEFFVLALRFCGFFEPFFEKKWGESPFYRWLKEEDSALQRDGIQDGTRVQLRLDHIRPANHPVRRLAFLAKLLSDPKRHSLNDRLWECWRSNWRGTHRHQWKLMKELLIQELPTYSDPYWESHYIFETKELSLARGSKLSLVGADLYREILLNVVLPFLYANIQAHGSDDERQAFENFYAYLPSSKTKKATYLGHRFFGETPKKLALLHADTQQGAYQIHRDFCVHHEASCQGCQFVELNNKL